MQLFCVVCEATATEFQEDVSLFYDSHHSTTTLTPNCNNIEISSFNFVIPKWSMTTLHVLAPFSPNLATTTKLNPAKLCGKEKQHIAKTLKTISSSNYRKNASLYGDNPLEQRKKCFINLRSNTLCRLPLPPFYTLLRKKALLHAWWRLWRADCWPPLRAAYNSHFFYLRPTIWRRHSHA